MSGHSKWHSIKHKKGKEDAKRGQLFSKLSKAIILAAKEGGGNPSANIALANAIEKAKSYSMPGENIDRAIKRGTGELGGAALEEITYEGYAASGVAVLVEVLSDNRNRAAADVRRIFSRGGGNLGTSGSVAWMFDKKGMVIVNKADAADEDELLELALNAGAEDLVAQDDHYEITTTTEDFRTVVQALREAGVEMASSEITMMPKDTVKLDREGAKKVLRLMDALEEYEDVQEVYSNFDIPDEILEQLSEES
ncbi:MAG: YebC/PmpR family DNA-binding transcriptional regulator [Candidatus Geothermincolia bacterium]